MIFISINIYSFYVADKDTAWYSFCLVQEKCASLAEPYTTDSKGHVTLDDSQRRFLAQHSVVMLEKVVPIRNDVATMLQRCVALKIVVANSLV